MRILMNVWLSLEQCCIARVIRDVYCLKNATAPSFPFLFSKKKLFPYPLRPMKNNDTNYIESTPKRLYKSIMSKEYTAMSHDLVLT